MSCPDEKSYEDYFQCIKEYVNSNSSVEEASFFINKHSKTIQIQENEIFRIIYGYSILGHNNLPKNSQLIVLLKNRGGTERYIGDINKPRRDIYVFDRSRTQTPESIILRNYEDPKRLVKTVESRAYHYKTKRDIEKLEKDLNERRIDNFYVPLSLSFPLVLNNRKYFPNIYYISNPYTISTPYVYEIRHKYSSIIKKPIEIYNVDLNSISIMEFKEYSTLELFSLGLRYGFELNQENLNKFEIQIKYDEFIYRFYYSITKIVNLTSTLKFSPEDIGTYQYIMNTDNNDVELIDMGSGFRISTRQRGLEKIIFEDLNYITEGVLKSPLLKHCTKNGNYVICNEKIKESELPKMLVADIRRSLIENYPNYYNNKTDNLLKNIKIAGLPLDRIIIKHKEDEFEENVEDVLKVIKLYLRGHNK
jgi:hypothetical protein